MGGLQNRHEQQHDKGVYAGAVTITPSSSARQAIAMTASGQPPNFPMISPEKIADEVWSLVTKPDRVEAVVPAPPAK